jgi:phosphopantetheine adenylyltransferase
MLFECIEATQRKCTLSDVIERMAREYNVNSKGLKKLCDDVNRTTQYSFYESICVISEDLENGLNINQIILKYNLDKELI